MYLEAIEFSDLFCCQLEEETSMRVEEEVRKRVEAKLGSEEVGLEIERRIEEGRKKLFDDAKAQLQREKEAALAEARQKEWYWIYDLMLELRDSLQGIGLRFKQKEVTCTYLGRMC
ncbi:uncharacterized protein LOC142544776 [Primulina tabacum]|uniref:uncharacterized protein LOC142544776 n=1 Tax=Primulina tabacum TaxID=48773 RepID=UPI003F5A2B35